MAFVPRQPFSKFEPFFANFRLRTCRAARGPADVRYVQLVAKNHLKFEKSAWFKLYPVLGEVLAALQEEKAGAAFTL